MKNILLLSCLLFSGFVYSQIGIGSSTVQERNLLRVGGGMGMNFGENSRFSLNISPFIGYEIVPNLEAGLTAGYQYAKERYYKQHLFSVGPFLNYYPMQNIFLRAHFEHFNGTTKYNSKGLGNHHPSFNQSYSTNFDENAFWVGGGFRSGERVQFFAGIVYNLLHDKDKSAFAEAYQPILGVSVGL